ncbi:MAG: hypothetical protein M3015_06565 [Bacteroidota bacterium]|nr:hypothetical protein [Bacteroidota bacterium]
MSIAELKLKAIEKLASLENEETVKNILSQLNEKENLSDSRLHNLSKHFDSISSRYDDTLQKLAQ